MKENFWHRSGPIAISNGGQITQLAHDFLRASDAVGIPYSDDIQGKG